MKNKIIKLIMLAHLSFGLSASMAVQHIIIVNAGCLDKAILEAVRSHAERELYVSVASTNISALTGNTMRDIGESAKNVRTSIESRLIVLGKPSQISSMHYAVMTNEQISVINVQAVNSEDIALFTRRLQRLSLRAVASLFGIGSDSDPFCVMHDYKTLDQLDRIGINFSPPWGEKFRQAAKAGGLTVRPLFPRQKSGVINNTPSIEPDRK